jgi:hypothetical protein
MHISIKTIILSTHRSTTYKYSLCVERRPEVSEKSSIPKESRQEKSESVVSLLSKLKNDSETDERKNTP